MILLQRADTQAPIKKRIIKKAVLKEGDNILDVACGNGRLLGELLKSGSQCFWCRYFWKYDFRYAKFQSYRLSCFSGALIADTYNYVVGVIKSQLNENGKANALLGISLKNQLAFCRKYNLQIQDRQKALGDHCEKARITDFRDGINQNAYFKNKQYENIAFLNGINYN